MSEKEIPTTLRLQPGVKLSKIAKNRWLTMSPEYKKWYKETISQGMKSHWEKKTPEERSSIAKKAAATRKANKAAKVASKGKGFGGGSDE
jgi:hypothetical protein